MAKILINDGKGKYTLGDLPNYSGIMSEDLFSKWSIEVYHAYLGGALFPRDPEDVWHDGILEMSVELIKDPKAKIDAHLRLLRKLDDNGRKGIAAERENFRALQDAEHDPDTFEETLADGNTEPNEHVCQPIARQYILRILPRLEPDTKRALIAWMASGRKKENLEKAARMMHEPAQTYRDRLSERLAEARAVCMELAKEDHQNESCW
jgi:hypothetical protein